MIRLQLPGREVRLVTSLLCLFLFLGLQVFAASSFLHKVIHHEAGTPDHHCVITLLTQGQVGTASAGLQPVVFLAALLYCQPALKSAALFSPLYRLSPSRPPPGL